MMTLTNSFHNTECRVRLTEAERERIERDRMTAHPQSEEYRRAKRIMRRVWKKLCGIDGCTCCNSWGERG